MAVPDLPTTPVSMVARSPCVPGEIVARVHNAEVAGTYEYQIIDVEERALATLAASGWRVTHVIPPGNPGGARFPKVAVGSGPRLLLERPVASDDVIVDKDAVARLVGELFSGRGLPPGT
jgi:hypothetical protein